MPPSARSKRRKRSCDGPSTSCATSSPHPPRPDRRVETFAPFRGCHGPAMGANEWPIRARRYRALRRMAPPASPRSSSISYNVELKDDEGLLGDRANKGAFRAILERWRKPLRKAGGDPFGEEASEDISRKKLDSLLAEGDPEAAGVLQGAIEDFAQALALVIQRFLQLTPWRDTERIVVSGGFRANRVGELTIGRAAVILKSEKVPIDLLLIRNVPDEAALIGAAHLAPRWMFEAHDAILAVDIGGTNIR